MTDKMYSFCISNNDFFPSISLQLHSIWFRFVSFWFNSFPIAIIKKLKPKLWFLIVYAIMVLNIEQASVQFFPIQNSFVFVGQSTAFWLNQQVVCFTRNFSFKNDYDMLLLWVQSYIHTKIKEKSRSLAKDLKLNKPNSAYEVTSCIVSIIFIYIFSFSLDWNQQIFSHLTNKQTTIKFFLAYAFLLCEMYTIRFLCIRVRTRAQSAFDPVPK